MSMSLRITPTPELATVNGTTSRIWSGKTPDGHDVLVFVVAIGTTPDSDAAAAAELEPALMQSLKRAATAIDLRHVY